jgi:hypothetical protein
MYSHNAATVDWSPRQIYRLVRDFYRRPSGWLAAAISTVVLVYGGGALMFWYHSIYLGEGGPAISPTLHWFVDSTFGLFFLTPVVAVVVPIAARTASRYTGKLSGAYYAMMGGTLFALATVPGPVMHDNFVGRGTWLSTQLTQMWGTGQVPPPGHHYAMPVSLSLQLAFALPLYIGLMGLLWTGAVYARSRRPAKPSTVESVVSQA